MVRVTNSPSPRCSPARGPLSLVNDSHSGGYYNSKGLQPPGGLKAHSTSSWALIRNTARWATPHTFEVLTAGCFCSFVGAYCPPCWCLRGDIVGTSLASESKWAIHIPIVRKWSDIFEIELGVTYVTEITKLHFRHCEWLDTIALHLNTSSSDNPMS